MFDNFHNHAYEDAIPELICFSKILSTPITSRIFELCIELSVLDSFIDVLSENPSNEFALQLYICIYSLASLGRPFINMLSDNEWCLNLFNDSIARGDNLCIETTIKIAQCCSQFTQIFDTPQFDFFVQQILTYYSDSEIQHSLLRLFVKIINDTNASKILHSSTILFESSTTSAAEPYKIQELYFSVLKSYLSGPNTAQVLISLSIPKLLCSSFKQYNTATICMAFKILRSIFDISEVTFSDQLTPHIFLAGLRVQNEKVQKIALSTLAAAFANDNSLIGPYFNLMSDVRRLFLSGTFELRKNALIVITNVVTMSRNDAHRIALAQPEICQELFDMINDAENQEVEDMAATLLLHFYEFGNEEIKEHLQEFVDTYNSSAFDE